MLLGKRARPRNLRRRPDLRGRQQTTGNVSHPLTFRADRHSRAYRTKSPILKLQKRLRAVVICTIPANRLRADGALLPASPAATINGMHTGVVLSIRYHNAERETVTSVLGEPQSFAPAEMERFAGALYPEAEPVPEGATG